MIEIKWQAHPAHQEKIRCLQFTSLEDRAPEEGEAITRPFLVDRARLEPVPMEAAIVVLLRSTEGIHSAVVHLKRLPG